VGSFIHHLHIETQMREMFLPDVENNPKPDSPYTPLIEQARSAGREYPQIWHLFAFKPHATQHLARFTQEILREEAPLSPGFRELIAARTSGRNDCPF
jgi:alkylhydroperoxidase family enzyme